MKKDLFRSKKFRTLAVLGATLIPLATAGTASADGLLGLGTSSLFATAQGTSVLGTEVPVLGTQGWTLTLPVGTQVAPQFVWNALDFTVTGSVTVGGLEICNLYLDPRMDE
ncbi:MAG TPA: hypothetical protein VME01_04545 [Solirubrobacteraceae bacterium]|nr:hypothetical protein [Solirubrobacteraceae bacterium]